MGEPLVIVTHFPASNDVPLPRFMIVMRALVGAIYPDRINDIEFQLGEEHPQGVNYIYFQADLNNTTAAQLMYKLKGFFGKKFAIRFYKKIELDRLAEMNEAEKLLHEQLDT